MFKCQLDFIKVHNSPRKYEKNKELAKTLEHYFTPFPIILYDMLPMDFIGLLQRYNITYDKYDIVSSLWLYNSPLQFLKDRNVLVLFILQIC